MSEETKIDTSESKEQPEAKKPASEEKAEKVAKPSNKSVAQLEDENHKLLKESMGRKATIQELKAEKAELETNLEKVRTEELAQQGKWEQLYKEANSKAEEMEKAVEDREQRLLDNHKLHAVTEKLRFKKPEYKAFVDRNAIQLDEKGNVDVDSLDKEVERLRQSHNELLDNKPVGQLPNYAGQGNPEKPLSEMSQDEMVQFIMKSGVFNN